MINSKFVGMTQNRDFAGTTPVQTTGAGKKPKKHLGPLHMEIDQNSPLKKFALVKVKCNS